MQPQFPCHSGNALQFNRNSSDAIELHTNKPAPSGVYLYLAFDATLKARLKVMDFLGIFRGIFC
jgi:hypothetical protein